MDRAKVAMVIGGTIPASVYGELSDLIESTNLAVEWDGDPFDRDRFTSGKSLRLYAQEVSGGSFDDIEEFCVDLHIPFSRWNGSNAGSISPKRVVFMGTGKPVSYVTTEDDDILIDRDTIKKLASIEAIMAYFDAADTATPPLIVTEETASKSA